MGLEQITGPNIIENAGPWLPYTPVITAGSGTFTSVSATGRYQQIGKTVIVALQVAIATNGSAATTVTATLPVSASSSNSAVLTGRETLNNGKQLQGFIVNTPTLVSIVNYDNSYPGGNGFNLLVSGSYESV